MNLVVFLVLVIPHLFVNGVCGFNFTFNSSDVEVFVDGSVQVDVIFVGTENELEQIKTNNWTVFFEPSGTLEAEFRNSSFSCDSNKCIREIDIKGLFLGFGRVSIARMDPKSRTWIKLEPPLVVTVLRQDTLMNKIFIAFVATVVSLNYINMGCALDLGIVKKVLKRPIGPIIGFFCQFVVMPL
ncbi:solute carrier family 10 member 6, partial [Nephila pilipes]